MGQKMLLFRGAWSHSWIFVEVRVVQSFCYVIYFIFNICHFFVEAPLPKQESERSCICVLGCRFGSFYDFEKKMILELLRQCGIFRIAQTVWYFCFCFSFYHSKIT